MPSIGEYTHPWGHFGKRRKSPRTPATMPFEVTYVCGHRTLYRLPVHTLGQDRDAIEAAGRANGGLCPDCASKGGA
jgi:hypothetical protein